jgi:hypothetical protein
MTITFGSGTCGGAAMQPSELDFESRLEEDKDDVARPKSPEERLDQFGIRTALVLLCIAFFMAAMWLVSEPSFQKCIAVQNVTERDACFDSLRNEFLKPPTR